MKADKLLRHMSDARRLQAATLLKPRGQTGTGKLLYKTSSYHHKEKQEFA